ncbi:hypothetical protein VPH35_072903 [Triticum aestivum]
MAALLLSSRFHKSTTIASASAAAPCPTPHFLSFPLTTAKASAAGNISSPPLRRRPPRPRPSLSAPCPPPRPPSSSSAPLATSVASSSTSCSAAATMLSLSPAPAAASAAKKTPEEVVFDLAPASVILLDVTDPGALLADLSRYGPVHAAICCLASRSGGVQHSWRVDCHATLHTLQAARSLGAAHFILLSVRHPPHHLLQEPRLPGRNRQEGNPYVMFGDGKLCACNPISEEDLASFTADCIFDQEKANKVLPIGGPGKALTPLEQGEMLFRLLGCEPRFIKVLDGLAKVFPGLEDVAEFGKIGRYYCVGEHASARSRDRGVQRQEDAELWHRHARALLR